MHFPHELKDEFPGEEPLIEKLAKSSHDFAQLVTRYDEVNHHIFDIETEDEPTADDVLEKLKKRRLKLKDEIADILRKTERRLCSTAGMWTRSAALRRGLLVNS